MAEPLYRQIAEDLRTQIESGELEPGQQLRTEGELRDHYGASRNTVRDAIKSLICLGLVETRPGQGIFVIGKVDPFVTTLSGDPKSGSGGGEGTSYLSELSERNRKPSTSRLQVEIQEASPEVAAGLWVGRGTEVISRHKRRFIDDTPWSMQTSYYAVEFADRGAERLRSARGISEGIVEYLAETIYMRQVGYRDWITVRAPNPTEADAFRHPMGGVQTYETFRTASDQTGASTTVTVSMLPADRDQFMADIGDTPVARRRSCPHIDVSRLGDAARAL